MGLKFSCMSDVDLKNSDNSIPYFDLAGNTYISKVVDVYDGDTCSIVIRLNGKLEKFKLRCKGYDSPEMKPPLSSENRENIINNAIKARNYFISKVTNCKLLLHIHYSKDELKEVFKLNTKLVKVKSHGWDKYGRLLGEIFVDDININEDMINNNYGYRYDGGTKQKLSFNI